MSATAAKPRPLTGITMIEIGGGYAGAYCGKMMADFGASVLKLEPPGGVLERHRKPLLDMGNGRAENPYQAWLDTNKESLCLDSGSSDDASRWRTLAAGCDLVIDSRPMSDGVFAGWHVPAGPIHLRLSWYGEDGPYAGRPGSDLVARALSGSVKMTGPVDGPPLAIDSPVAQITAGTVAYTGALAALLGDGVCRQLDLSVLEANVVLSEYLVAQCVGEGMTERRYGINRFAPNFPLGIYECAAGHIGISVVTPSQWIALCKIIERPDLADDPGLWVNADRMRQADRLDEAFIPAFRKRTAEEWFALGRENRLPFAVVPDMSTLLGQEVHNIRGAFTEVLAGTARFRAPTVPLHLTATPPAPNGPAAVPCAACSEPVSCGVATRTEDATALPLDGIRIVDLTMGWAGPVSTRQLADLGADVIKVESCRYPDWWRGVDFTETSIAALAHERTARFNMQNRNKRGVTVDLTRPEGIALFERLLQTADAVAENNSAEVMPKLGLGYDRLRAIRPDIVALSMPAFGVSSAWNDVRAYGSTLEHASGLPSVIAGPGNLPVMSHQAIGDPIGGLNAAAALLTALAHRRRNGEGQFIDLSQVQCLFPLIAPWLIQQSAFGRLSADDPISGASGILAGCYRCDGEESWLALAIDTPHQLAALSESLGIDLPENRTALDHALSEWFCTRPLEVALAVTLRAGVAAGPAQFPSEIIRDPHLSARAFWQPCDRPHFGPHEQPSMPLRIAGAFPPIRRAAPLLGEHNREVFIGELGLSEQDFAALERDGIIGTAPLISRHRSV